MASPPRSARSKGVEKALDMLRCSVSFVGPVLLAVVLAGCGEEDGSGPPADPAGARADLGIYGEWEGTRDGDDFFLDLTNTYIDWNMYTGSDLLGDVVYYDNSADFGVILWTDPSALAGKYQKFSWDIQSDTTAVLQLYDEKDSLSDAIGDTFMKYNPILVTRIDEEFRGCHGGQCG